MSGPDPLKPGTVPPQIPTFGKPSSKVKTEGVSEGAEVDEFIAAEATSVLSANTVTASSSPTINDVEALIPQSLAASPFVRRVAALLAKSNLDRNKSNSNAVLDSGLSQLGLDKLA